MDAQRLCAFRCLFAAECSKKGECVIVVVVSVVLIYIAYLRTVADYGNVGGNLSLGISRVIPPETVLGRLMRDAD